MTAPFFEWILTSGLLQEEAALIQPGYDPPPFEASLSNLLNGGSVTSHGLRYDNFQFVAGPGPLNSVLLLTPPGQVDAASAGVFTHHGVLAHEPEYTADPQYADWLFLGARQMGGLGQPASGELWTVIYSFDVTAEQPGASITATSIYSNPNLTTNLSHPPGSISVDTMVSMPSLPFLPVAQLHLDSTTAGSLLSGDDGAAIAPQPSLRIRTIATLQGQAAFSAMIHSFQLVPEPLTEIQLAFALAASWIGRRRRPRSLDF